MKILVQISSHLHYTSRLFRQQINNLYADSWSLLYSTIYRDWSQKCIDWCQLFALNRDFNNLCFSNHVYNVMQWKNYFNEHGTLVEPEMNNISCDYISSKILRIFAFATHFHIKISPLFICSFLMSLRLINYAHVHGTVFYYLNTVNTS